MDTGKGIGLTEIDFDIAIVSPSGVSFDRTCVATGQLQ